jgi:hypothetical protein
MLPTPVELRGEASHCLEADTRRQINEWRLRAAELRAMADDFDVPSVQEALRRAAENYDALAERAEELLDSGPAATNGKAG